VPDQGSLLDRAVRAANAGAAPAIPLDKVKRSEEEALVEPAREDRAAAPSGAEPASLEPANLETGRALALADFSPPAVNPGEALIRLAYPSACPRPRSIRSASRQGPSCWQR